MEVTAPIIEPSSDEKSAELIELESRMAELRQIIGRVGCNNCVNCPHADKCSVCLEKCESYTDEFSDDDLNLELEDNLITGGDVDVFDVISVEEITQKSTKADVDPPSFTAIEKNIDETTQKVETARVHLENIKPLLDPIRPGKKYLKPKLNDYEIPVFDKEVLNPNESEKVVAQEIVEKKPVELEDKNALLNKPTETIEIVPAVVEVKSKKPAIKRKTAHSKVKSVVKPRHTETKNIKNSKNTESIKTKSVEIAKKIDLIETNPKVEPEKIAPQEIVDDSIEKLDRDVLIEIPEIYINIHGMDAENDIIFEIPRYTQEIRDDVFEEIEIDIESNIAFIPSIDNYEPESLGFLGNEALEQEDAIVDSLRDYVKQVENPNSKRRYSIFDYIEEHIDDDYEDDDFRPNIVDLDLSKKDNTILSNFRNVLSGLSEIALRLTVIL